MSPCWTITTCSVSLNVADLNLLQKALETQLGVKVQRRGDVLTFNHSSQRYPITINGGRVELVRGNESFADQIKVAYSREAIQTQAQRMKWVAKEVKQNVFELTPRF